MNSENLVFVNIGLRSLYLEATEAAKEATSHAGRALSLGLRCAQAFRSLRDSEKKGEKPFREVIREAIPEITDATIDRWIRMEEKRGDLLNDPSVMRQAFLTFGLLPEPEPIETTREEKPWWNYVAHLGRAERAIREQVRDFSALSDFERVSLKKRLAPLVEIFEKL
jgi:hypothetical protein